MMNEIENQKHIQKTYSEKAMNLLKICIFIMIFSLITYFIAILYDAFDFGLIFELIAFAFIVLAYNQIKGNKIKSCKKSTIIAMIPIGWLIIYDLIDLIVNIKDVASVVAQYYLSIDQFFYYIEPYLFDVVLVATIILLFKTVSSLNKAGGNNPTENYIDSFYDKL